MLPYHDHHAPADEQILSYSMLTDCQSRRHPTAANPDAHAAKDAEVVAHLPLIKLTEVSLMFTRNFYAVAASIIKPSYPHLST